jgi:hypothetical protein
MAQGEGRGGDGCLGGKREGSWRECMKEGEGVETPILRTISHVDVVVTVRV